MFLDLLLISVATSIVPNRDVPIHHGRLLRLTRVGPKIKGVDQVQQTQGMVELQQEGEEVPDRMHMITNLSKEKAIRYLKVVCKLFFKYLSATMFPFNGSH